VQLEGQLRAWHRRVSRGPLPLPLLLMSPFAVFFIVIVIGGGGTNRPGARPRLRRPWRALPPQNCNDP